MNTEAHDKKTLSSYRAHLQRFCLRDHLFLCLLFTISTFACGATQPLTDVVTAEPTAQISPYLWHIEGPTTSTYLYGTIHAGVEFNELNDDIIQAMDSASRLVIETDIRQINPLQFMTLATLPAGENLSVHFNDDDWQALIAAFSPSIPESLLERYRPWFLQMIILQTMIPSSEPMDLEILLYCEARGHQISYLESPEQQLEMLVATPDELSIQTAIEWLSNPIQMEEEFDTLINRYREGDINQTAALILDNDELTLFAEWYELLLYERNQAWIPVIEDCINGEGCFIAVGLAHLVGPGSVPDLLSNMGYELVYGR